MMIKLDGALTYGTAPRVRQRLFEAVQNSARSVVADLSEISSIDSAGLAILVEALRLSRRRGGRFILLNPNPSVIGALDVMRLSELFPVEHPMPMLRRHAG